MSKLWSNKRTVATIAAMALATGIAGAAYAASDDDSYKRAGEESVSSKRSSDSTVFPIDEIVARLRTAGYTEIREVERERGRYEVKGRDAQGQPVELYMDARTGEVLKVERDD